MTFKQSLYKLVLILCLIHGFVDESTSSTQDPATIAAVVNSSVITSTDLDNRFKLVTVFSGVPTKKSAKALVIKQLLRSMIDEHLQEHEAKAQGIVIESNAVDDAIKNIERQQGLLPGEVTDKLEKSGVSPSTLRDQIHANLVWVELVRTRLKPFVHVTEHEIDVYLNDQKNKAAKPHHELQEIFLLVNDQAPLDQALIFAKHLKQQLSQGADFGALAQQFSDSSSAIQGGYLGWVQENGLDDTRNAIVFKMKPGQVSDPIEANGGVYLMRMNEKKEPSYQTSTKIDYAELTVPLYFVANDKVLKDKIDETTNLVANSKSAEDLKKIAMSKGFNIEVHKDKNLDVLPDSLAHRLSSLELQKPSAVYREGSVLKVYLVDKKNSQKELAGIDTRPEAHAFLANQKIEAAANALLRTLRRKALVRNKL